MKGCNMTNANALQLATHYFGKNAFAKELKGRKVIGYKDGEKSYLKISAPTWYRCFKRILFCKRRGQSESDHKAELLAITGRPGLNASQYFRELVASKNNE
jgi:hypothetical protein